jgi:phosphoribosyl 1,2-cyclic phosphate phosphodiesterase
MNIRLLGTGAADGIPGFFRNDPVSKHARECGGRDVRTRCAALVDGVLKIDLPPDTFSQLQRDRLDPRDWSALLFTHSHEDHFAVGEIQYALYPFTEMDHMPYTIYGNETICRKIEERYPNWPIELVQTRSFESYQHGSYTITPVKARHIEEEDCHNLIIERGGKSILYATDTGVWTHDTFEFLSRYHLDVLVIECTDGLRKGNYLGHLDIDACVGVVDALREAKVLGSDSRVVTTHHAASGGARHCDLEKALLKHGIEPGYDGMVIKF